MAMITSLSETSICNMALGRIGALRITNLEDSTENTAQAIQCRLHYSQTRDALIRSHWWRCCRARAILSANTTDEPLGEWDYAYDLPTDFIRMKQPYEDIGSGATSQMYTYSLEGKQLLSNESPMEIHYIKRVTDPNEFDPLFVEVFILKFALKIVMPLTQDKELRRELNIELYGTPRQPGLMSQVRALDKQETNTTGVNDMATWNEAAFAGAGDPTKRYS